MISQLPVRVPVYSLQFSLNIERFPHTASFQNIESHPLIVQRNYYIDNTVTKLNLYLFGVQTKHQ